MTVTTAWVLWLVCGMVFILSTRNPFYLMLTSFFLYWLGFRLAKNKSFTHWLKNNLRFLLTMVGFSALINILFTHSGKTVLFNLPQHWPLIGGAITLESLAYGVINGLVINALYILFNIFNQALSVKQITRLIPAAFKPIATMVTISLTFFPSIQQRIKEIREAQLIRGNPMKKIADWVPVLIPLLVSSLEDAFQLSESMTARGFHTRVATKSNQLSLVLLICAVFGVFTGWIFSLYDYPQLLSYGLYLFAGVIFIVIISVSGRKITAKSNKQENWNVGDKLASIFFSLALIAEVALLIFGNASSFSYSTYPVLALPELQWFGLILAILPGLPLLINNHD